MGVNKFYKIEGVSKSIFKTKKDSEIEKKLSNKTIVIDGNYLVHNATKVNNVNLSFEGKETNHIKIIFMKFVKWIKKYNAKLIIVWDSYVSDKDKDKDNDKDNDKDKKLKEKEKEPKEKETENLKKKEQEKREKIKQKAKETVQKDLENNVETKEYIKNLSKDISSYIEDVKKLAELFQIPTFKSPPLTEGEKVAAEIVIRNIGDIVYTHDSDALVYGAKEIFWMHSGEYYFLTLEDILKNMEVDYESLVRIAISIGTDINVGIHGVGVKTYKQKCAKSYDDLSQEDRKAYLEFIRPIEDDDFLTISPSENELKIDIRELIKKKDYQKKITEFLLSLGFVSVKF